ncbi:MAG: hypothetical protein ACYS9X_32530, partial [Planctomycetota bacterium]
MAKLSAKERSALVQKLVGAAVTPAAPGPAAGTAASTPAPVAPAQRKSARPAPPRRAAPPTKGGGVSGLAVAGALVGALGGVGAVVLLVGGQEDDPSGRGGDRVIVDDRTTPPPRRPVPTPRDRDGGETTPRRPVPRPADGSAAAQRLWEIESWQDEDLSRYADMAKALGDFPGAYPDAEAEKKRAADLSAEVERQFRKMAEAALREAGLRAEAFASEWWFAEAAKSFDGRLDRFGVIEGYKSRLEEAKKTALAGIERARAEAAKSLIARAELLVQRDEKQRATALLKGHETWPEEERRRAARLARRIRGEAAAPDDAEGVWSQFLADFHEAGKKGLDEAAALLKTRAGALRRAGLRAKADRYDDLVRRARSVTEIAGENLQNIRSGRTVTVRFQGAAVTGRPRGVAGKVLTLVTADDASLQVPLGRAHPEDVARLARATKTDAATLLLVRGRPRAGAELVADEAG